MAKKKDSPRRGKDKKNEAEGFVVKPAPKRSKRSKKQNDDEQADGADSPDLSRKEKKAVKKEAAAAAKAAKNMEAPKPRKRKARRRIGVEIDGSVVRAVEVDGTQVISYTTVTGSSSADAFSNWLSQANVKGASVTAVWAGERTHLRRITKPSVPPHVMRAALNTVADDVMPISADTFSLGASVYQPQQPEPEEGEAPVRIPEQAVMVAVESAVLEGLFDNAADAGAKLAPSELTFRSDGLHLAIRNHTSEILLVDDSHTVAARHLRAGGLDSLVRSLTTDEVDGAVRLSNVMRGMGGSDLDAAETVDRYLENLVEDFRSTGVYWQRNGLTIGNQVYVTGAGASLPGLPARLYDAAFQAEAAPLPFTMDLDAIERSERFAAYGSLLAATTDIEPGSLMELPNEILNERNRRQKTTTRRRRGITAVLLTMAAIVAVLYVPLLQARNELGVAEEALQFEKDELSQITDFEQLGDAVRAGQGAFVAATLGEVLWDKVALHALSLTPSDAEISTIKIALTPCPAPGTVANTGAAPAINPNEPIRARAGDCVTVSVAAALPGFNLSPVSAWLRLVENNGGLGVWPSDVRPGTENDTQNLTLNYAFELTESMIGERIPPGMSVEAVEADNG